MVYADIAAAIAQDTFYPLRFGVEQLPAVERFAGLLGQLQQPLSRFLDSLGNFSAEQIAFPATGRWLSFKELGNNIWIEIVPKEA